MTMMTPRRRMIRHLSQRFFTDADTFIGASLGVVGAPTCGAAVGCRVQVAKHRKTPGTHAWSRCLDGGAACTIIVLDLG